MTARDGGTTRRNDWSASWCGPSVFNNRGQRLNEIDLSTYRAPKTHADMTDADWEQAAVALREFEVERGIR